MKSLNIPLKVVGTIIPKKEKTDYFDIRFETEDQIYWASAFCMSLDYFLEDYQNEDEIRILTTSKGASNFAITDSGLDLIAHSMEKTLKEFYNFVKKSGQIDMAPFEGLKNITVTARRYFNIKHHSHKYRLMFEFNTKD